MDERRVIERFAEYAKIKGITFNKATVECKLSVGLLGKALSQGYDISRKTSDAILSQYKDLNREWLLIGVGDMLCEDNTIVKVERTDQVTDKDAIIEALIEENSALRATNDRLMKRLLAMR